MRLVDVSVVDVVVVRRQCGDGAHLSVSDFELCPPLMRSGARELARAGSLFVQKFSRKNQKVGL
jgi:hypothetical protein